MDEDMKGVYVNRSLTDFLFFMTIAHGALQGVEVRHHDTAVLAAIERLKEVDPTAFDSEDSFWPMYDESHGF